MENEISSGKALNQGEVTKDVPRSLVDELIDSSWTDSLELAITLHLSTCQLIHDLHLEFLELA